MSIVPALLAVQISLNASTRSRQAYGSYSGSAPETGGFRGLALRRLDLEGWRSFAYWLFVFLVGVLCAICVMAVIVGGVVLSAWIASTFSGWWMIAMVPLAVAADYGALRLMFLILVG